MGIKRRHYTEDPGEKAEHIADKEADRVWRMTRSYEAWSSAWKKIYNAALYEMQPC